MIKSLAHKALEKFFRTGSKAGIQPEHADKLNRQLTLLNVATEAEEMGRQGWRLHALKGDLEGYWSIWVSGNWRLIFRFVQGNAEVVDYLDYHQEYDDDAHA